ncbi:hypothetical protein ACPRNU_11500 [Chromobacterium vaccinii]|uniref:glycine-rich domain-containing protein n=1 Tax=Chromobacterium vaccinii TaxID=1108595 RepID=UPI003C78745A
MANLQETPFWEAGIYQLETSDPVLAGPDGIDNLQGKQLANRTAYLKQQVDGLQAGTPANLNTLQLLAAAVNNDPKYSGTVDGKLAFKADKASTLSGYGIVDGAAKSGDASQPFSVAPAVQSSQAVTLGQMQAWGGMQKFVSTSSTSFTVPNGIATIYISACGGGGGGSSACGYGTSWAFSGGGGGAGQSIIREPYSVVPGQVISISVGADGVGGGGAAPGGAGGPGRTGGATVIGKLITLVGGDGGSPPNAQGPGSGGGGYPNGGSGSGSGLPNAGTLTQLWPSGAGASSPFGGGGPAVCAYYTGQAGINGAGYGSGGSGSSAPTGGNNVSSLAAGNGASGLVMIEW